MAIEDWFLSIDERGNPATRLDSSRRGGKAWSDGNLVRPLIHGVTYFAELSAAVERMEAGDLLMFVDWRGDPDQLLTGEPGSEVSALLCDAAARGVRVHGLIWRSHLDRLQFSARENRHLGEEIEAAGGCCLLDMRVRTGGSHHQKFVVLRHSRRPELDTAYVGGIDLCHSRRDDATHAGDPQTQPMAPVYGKRPPWHDVQLAIQGPAVADVETVFRERWEDPRPLSRNPIHRSVDRMRRDDARRASLPSRSPTPAPVGPHSVQLLRTYPQRLGGYPFAPRGERSIARGYIKALSQARDLIYLEDQYLWSRDVAQWIVEALRDRPSLHLIAVLPHYPDQGGRALPPNLVGRHAAVSRIRRTAPDRVGIYGIENTEGTPIYVHAKVCVIDDIWATTGSDNFNRRSWTHDSELAAAVWHSADEDAGSTRDPQAATGYARDLRMALSREHLGDGGDPSPDLADPVAAFYAFARSADALQRWTDSDRRTSRPAGQLRPLTDPPLRRMTRAWATPLYRTVYDPDGRRPVKRWTNTY
ncbi:MAG TPA: phospholipase D family protein [Mycobacteriales bacterium]|jgi:phosphatidylserine/phosphatidylglycerophosphate/cardiolipin synthase-like enzyme|nr:phospholipase D family protein [Mycobacteriales bacterium]